MRPFVPPRVLGPVRLMTLVVVAAFLGLAVWHPSILILVFASVLWGVMLDGAAQSVARRTGFGRRVTVAGLLVVGLGVLGLGGWQIGLAGARQYARVTREVGRAKEDVVRYFDDKAWSQSLVDNVPSFSTVAQEAADHSATIMGALNSVTATVTGTLIAALLGLYLVWQRDLYIDGVVKLCPPPWRERAREVLGRVGARLRSWLVGRLLSMIAVGILTAIGLYILGIPLAGPLAIIAGLCAFVPFLGPLISVVPAMLLAFTQSPLSALHVAIAYVVVQQIEGNLITPIIQQDKASVPPVLLLVGQALAGALFGIPGIIFATPALVVLMVLVESLYLEGVFGETPDEADLDERSCRPSTRAECARVRRPTACIS